MIFIMKSYENSLSLSLSHYLIFSSFHSFILSLSHSLALTFSHPLALSIFHSLIHLSFSFSFFSFLFSSLSPFLFTFFTAILFDDIINKKLYVKNNSDIRGNIKKKNIYIYSTINNARNRFDTLKMFAFLSLQQSINNRKLV